MGNFENRLSSYAEELKHRSKSLLELAEEARENIVEGCGGKHDKEVDESAEECDCGKKDCEICNGEVKESDCGCNEVKGSDCGCNESSDLELDEDFIELDEEEEFLIDLEEEEGFATLEEEIQDIEETIKHLTERLKLKKTKIADRQKARRYRKSSAGKMAKRKRERDPKYKMKMIKAQKKKDMCSNRNMVWSMKDNKCVRAKERRK
jgi:hypothetical protein